MSPNTPPKTNEPDPIGEGPDPSANPGDPGPPILQPPRPLDPSADERLPVQRDVPQGA